MADEPEMSAAECEANRQKTTDEQFQYMHDNPGDLDGWLKKHAEMIKWIRLTHEAMGRENKA